MKKFLNIDDLRQLIKNIKSEFSKYAKKEDVPTKISDLEDDTGPGVFIQNAYGAEFACSANKAYDDGMDRSIVDTYVTKEELGTKEDYEYGIPQIENKSVCEILSIVSEIANDASLTSNEANDKSDEAMTIAKGRATGYVFDTVKDMNIALSSEVFTSTLVLGDNLYIRATDVPDYWWDGSAAQPLETQKVDLTEYATKAELGDIDKALDESIALCDSYLAWEVPV